MNEILISYIGMPEKEAERHTLSDGGFIMIEKKIKLMSSGQILSFCKACQKLESDVDVTDMSNRNYQIDGSPCWADVRKAGTSHESCHIRLR